MAFGFPARFKGSRTYQLRREELAAAVKSALENLGWPYRESPGEGFLASVPFGGGTWGAEFKVTILPGGAVGAESRCVTVRMPQVFDFGRNRRNVETFFASFERGIGRGVGPGRAYATARESAVRAAPQNSRAVALLGDCVTVTFALIVLMYFIFAVVGLLTGNLFLPGKGSSSGVIHGVWARVLSVIILALLAWVGVWSLRNRKRRRGRERSER